MLSSCFLSLPPSPSALRFCVLSHAISPWCGVGLLCRHGRSLLSLGYVSFLDRLGPSISLYLIACVDYFTFSLSLQLTVLLWILLPVKRMDVLCCYFVAYTHTSCMIRCFLWRFYMGLQRDSFYWLPRLERLYVRHNNASTWILVAAADWLFFARCGAYSFFGHCVRKHERNDTQAFTTDERSHTGREFSICWDKRNTSGISV